MVKVLSFPDGAEVPVDKAGSKESIADHQTKKFADSLADDVVIQLISSLQQDGLTIVNYSGTKVIKVPEGKPENVIEFESEIDFNDTN